MWLAEYPSERDGGMATSFLECFLLGVCIISCDSLSGMRMCVGCRFDVETARPVAHLPRIYPFNEDNVQTNAIFQRLYSIFVESNLLESACE